MKTLLNPNDWLAQHPKFMVVCAILLTLLLGALEEIC